MKPNKVDEGIDTQNQDTLEKVEKKKKIVKKKEKKHSK